MTWGPPVNAAASPTSRSLTSSAKSIALPGEVLTGSGIWPRASLGARCPSLGEEFTVVGGRGQGQSEVTFLPPALLSDGI